MFGGLSQLEECRGVGVFPVSNASSFAIGSDLLSDGGYQSW